jgi:hypothetical protein
VQHDDSRVPSATGGLKEIADQLCLVVFTLEVNGFDFG